MPSLGGMAAAGGFHTVLLKSDGTATACGSHMQIDRLQWTECNIPDLAEGVIYTHVAAGNRHTVLLKSDGTATAVGRNFRGQCNIPDLAEGVIYTHVAAGHGHIVLLKSDGTATAVGRNDCGQCNIPDLSEGDAYGGKKQVLTSDFGESHAVFRTLSGREVCRIEINATDTIRDIQNVFVNTVHGKCEVVLPNGKLLSRICMRSPSAMVEPFMAQKRRRTSE